MKTNRIFNIAIVILLIVLVVLLGMSCNPERKIVREQTAAIHLVNANDSLQAIVGETYLKVHPCANDTTFVPGKPVLVKGKDSAYPVFVNTDQIIKIKQPIDTFFKAYGARLTIDTSGHIRLVLPDRDTIFIHDTSVVVDKHEIDRVNDLLNQSTNKIQTLTTQVTTYQTNEANIWYIFKILVSWLFRQWWFYILLLGYLAYLFRSPLATLLTKLK